MNRIIHLLAAISLAGTISTAQAISVHTTKASFDAILGGGIVSTFDFEGFTPGDTISNPGMLIDPDGNGLDATISSSAPYGLIVEDFFPTTSPDNFLGANDGSAMFFGGDTLTLSFTQDLRAVGLFVIGTPGDIWANDFTLATSSGSVNNSGTPEQLLGPAGGQGDVFFLGLIAENSSEAFSSFTLSSMFVDINFNIDDISVSAEVMSVIPIPAAAWLFGSALFGLIGWGRCRSRTASHNPNNNGDS